MAEKKTPLRRCAGCNTQRQKNEFVRIVRMPSGEIVFDPTGKMNGRGIYLCRDLKCLMKVKKSRRPEQNFGKSVPDEVYEEIERNLGGEK